VITLAAAKKNFFDAERISRKVDAGKRRSLARAGAYVRRVAANSIRTAKRNPDGTFKPSAPGQPPRSRTGLLKRFLLYSYDDRSGNVVVGPVRISRLGGEAPSLLEFGGVHSPTKRERTKRLRVRKVGGGGEVRIRAVSGNARVPAGLQSSSTRRSRQAPDDQRRTRRVTVHGPRGGVGEYEVAYGLLRTRAQADRANRINRLLYESRASRQRIAARPYMKPALVRSLPYIPKGFKGSVSQ
jgi:hypothetical protein